MGPTSTFSECIFKVLLAADQRARSLACTRARFSRTRARDAAAGWGRFASVPGAENPSLSVHHSGVARVTGTGTGVTGTVGNVARRCFLSP